MEDRLTMDNVDSISPSFITELDKDGKSFQGTPVDDPEFCCFKFNSRFDI